MNKAKHRRLWVFVVLALLCSACTKPTGHITLNFSFVVDSDPLQLDACLYQNAAGNLFEVNDVQFFISHVMLETASGEMVEITDNQGIHYTDIRIPNTLSWHVSDEIPAGGYKSIAFVFGLEGEQNTTGFFPNPPENNMSWPDVLGGGYHYMKINGRWIDEAGVSKGQTSSITLQMNVNAWFSDPYLFDFNEFGGSIMQNREAQMVLRANGHNVFSAL